MNAKLDQLKSLLHGCGRTLVAYSGGVDSTFLAKVAAETLGEQMLAVIADTPSLPRRELAQALALAEQLHIPVRVIKTNEMVDPRYTSNPVDRCYFCKSELFGKLVALARTEGWQTIVYGENISDSGDSRPGTQAAAECGGRAPLREVGLTKAEIRTLSRELGLPTADKPQMACLSSRIPYGEPVTVETLTKIEAAENILRDANFRDVRVRHHGDVARIEVGADEIPRFFRNGLRESVVEAFKKLGYRYVALDLQGFRSGSGNEALTKEKGKVL